MSASKTSTSSSFSRVSFFLSLEPLDVFFVVGSFCFQRWPAFNTPFLVLCRVARIDSFCPAEENLRGSFGLVRFRGMRVSLLLLLLRSPDIERETGQDTCVFPPYSRRHFARGVYPPGMPSPSRRRRGTGSCSSLSVARPLRVSSLLVVIPRPDVSRWLSRPPPPTSSSCLSSLASFSLSFVSSSSSLIILFCFSVFAFLLFSSPLWSS